ncbi:MAG: SulP family inorganic anion transporter [Methanoregulaceae archaeon]|jgi:high affinity sulfate transporter 1|nr:SulP family inorganic anion transporter [Methanoregulaceae archaeon]
MSLFKKIAGTFEKFPVLEGILPVKASQIPLDIIAGITLAALAIPEVMGYAKIAGVPVVLGLYTLLLPMAVFAIFGSSKHLVVGADSATAAITATVLVTMAVPESPQYIALAGMVALLAAFFLIISRILKLGFIADFLSRAVLIGFLTGVGIQVALGQVPGMFGVPNEGTGLLLQVVHVFTQEISLMNGTTVLLSILVLGIIFCGGHFFRTIPWALLTVIGAIIASWALDLAAYGVTTIGTMDGGLPVIAFPVVSPDLVPDLLGIAIACFLVILAQSAATSRAYAIRYEEKFNENVDLVGLGLSNIAAGMSGTFVVNGSPTKTEMVDSAGGRSQLAQVVTVGIVLLVLLFLTVPLSYLPRSVLAAIVFTIGIRLIDINGMKTILTLRPVEFMVALLTTLTVIFISVGWGIVIAIVLSILAHLRHSYHPINVLISQTPEGKWKSAPPSSGKQAVPGLAIYRFGANLYYANENRFTGDILDIAKSASPPLKWLCLSASMIGDIDYSGSESIKQLHGRLKKHGVELVISDIRDQVMRQLEKDRIIELIGKEHVFDSYRDAFVAYQELEAGP